MASVRTGVTRVERLAMQLFSHRVTLLTAGLGAFVLGALPLVALVHGLVPPARWHGTLFAVSVPITLWAIGLVVLATFFHPTQGLVGRESGAWVSRRRWARGGIRAYAALTVCAFGVSPVVVFGAV